MPQLLDHILLLGSKHFGDEDNSVFRNKMPILVVDEIVTQIDSNIPFTEDGVWDYKRDFQCLKLPAPHFFIEGKSAVTGVRLGVHLSTEGEVDMLIGQQYKPPPEADTLVFMRLYTEINFKDRASTLAIVPAIGYVYLDKSGQWVDKQLPIIPTRLAPAPVQQEWATMLVNALPMTFVGLNRWWDETNWSRMAIVPPKGVSRRNRKKYGLELSNYSVLQPKFLAQEVAPDA